MLTNINPYHMQWNTDVNGNPISVHKQEIQQVSPVYFNIQLDEIPDRYHRLSVKDMEGNVFYEVDDFSRITERSCYVDYNNGVVYFHHTKGANVVNIEYYGRGYKLIHSSRIIMENGARLTEALERSQMQTCATSNNEENLNVQEQINNICNYIRKQQKAIEMLTKEIEKLQNKE